VTSEQATTNDAEPTLALLAPPAQRDVLRQALADAVLYRDPPVDCRACAGRGELCDACADGLARARAYLSLGRELGVEISA
jgi:cellulase/cellobiase CelA1